MHTGPGGWTRRSRLSHLRGGARFVNAALTADFPDRTLEAIKGMRRSVRYKACLERAIVRLNEPEVVAAVDGDGPGEKGHSNTTSEVIGRKPSAKLWGGGNL